MRKLSVAVIGTGFWGGRVAERLTQLPNTELIAVCDMNKEKVQPVAEKFGVRGYTDSSELLRRKDVEAVTISVWSTNLATEALRALKAGKHVLVEKPMASTVQQARKIVDSAKRKRRFLMVGFIERFNPGVQRVKEALEKDEIGTLVSATARRVSQWPERVGDVGVVKDTAIHDIDVMRYLFGADPVAVYAKAGSLRYTRFEDYAQVMLTFSKGRTAFIESNWLTPYKVRSLLVTGSEAIMSLNYLTQEIAIETKGQTLSPRYEWTEPLRLELQHFADCVLNGKETIVSGLDGLRALQVAEAALKSAKKCSAVKLR